MDTPARDDTGQEALDFDSTFQNGPLQRKLNNLAHEKAS
jgi:hypothetical protein